MKRRHARALPIALVVLALDQGIKQVLRQTVAVCTPAMAFPTCATLPLIGRVDLVRFESNGGAPGFLPFFSLSTLVALLGLLLVPLYARWLAKAGWPAALAIGLQAGGALSNLADRVLYRASLDYVPAGQVVFNLADQALQLGLVLAVGLLLQQPNLFGRASDSGGSGARRSSAAARRLDGS